MRDSYYTKRAYEIAEDKQLLPLIYMIAEENGIDKAKAKRDRKKQYFIVYIVKYLKHETH